MSEIWIVVRPDANPDTVEAKRLAVENGHLVAYGWEDPVAAWAPGAWVTFAARPDRRSLENSKMSMACLHLALDAGAAALSEDARQWLETNIAILRADIEYTERQSAPFHHH